MVIVNKIVHALSIVSYVLIGFFILIESPIIFGYKPLIVLTGSMEPTYKVGSIIYYHSVNENELKVGDTITFTLDGTTITHRINAINDGLYETKGDANDSEDPTMIEYSNIKGRVSKISIPFIGIIYAFILNNYTIFIVILILILVYEFLISNLGILYKNKKKGNEEK